MKLALVGYGKMGRAVENAAQKRGHEIVLRIDHQELESIPEGEWAQVEAAIEFTQPDSAFNNIAFLLRKGVPVVCGTTGWLDQKPAIDALVKELDGSLIQSTNFSIGVNLFFRLNELAAELMAKYADYSPEITEIHHLEKKDKPSGTAITLAEGMLARMTERKHSWTNEPPTADDQLHIFSERVPHVPGTHQVLYSSAIDSIELKHVAHTREGFAAGAVAAAEWLKGRKGSYNMRDMLGF